MHATSDVPTTTSIPRRSIAHHHGFLCGASVRQAIWLAALLVCGCKSQSSNATSDGSTSSDSTTTQTATTNVDTSGTVTTEVDGSGSESSGDSGEPFVPIDPDLLTWQSLPILAQDATESAGQVAVAVDADGEIYLSAVFATDVWMPPWDVRVFQLVDDAWELVGGQPVHENATGSLSGTSLAVVGGEVFVVYYDDAGVLARYADGAWAVVSDIEPGATVLSVGGVVIDDEGRPVVLVSADDDIRAYRREGQTWSQVGGSIDSGSVGTPGFGTFVSGAGGRLATATSAGVQLFDGSAWGSLGAFAEPDAMLPAFPRLAIPSDGQPFVSWREDTVDGTRLYAARWNATTSAFERLAGDLSFEGPGASYSILAVDRADTLFAAWRESTVYVARFIDDAWTPYVGDGDVGQYTDGGTLPSIALTPEGLPVVAWEGFFTDTSVVGAARAVLK